MNDVDMISIVNNIKKIATPKQTNNMIFGEVTSVDPLKIDIGNHVVLSGKFLYLGQMCRPHKVTIPHTHKYSGKTEYGKANGAPGLVITTTGQAVTTVVETQGHTHDIKNQETDDVHKENCGTDYEKSVTIEIYPKLAVGDKVLMFAMNSNQLYYVAERVEVDE